MLKERIGINNIVNNIEEVSSDKPSEDPSEKEFDRNRYNQKTKILNSELETEAKASDNALNSNNSNPTELTDATDANKAKILVCKMKSDFKSNDLNVPT